MKVLQSTACLFLLITLAACETSGTYPISGEECGPEDPVKTLDASDCAVPGVG